MAEPNLPRLRKTIRRTVKGGWERVVLAPPGGSEASTDVVSASSRPPTDAELEELMAAVDTAVANGNFKMTFVLDDRSRVRIDARHGRAKTVSLDQERELKVMGGKQRPLEPAASAALLRTIGIMNPDGSISAKKAKKYKQVNHFVELCRPVLERLRAHRKAVETDPLRVLDLGCGNSYLTFVLAEALRLEETAASFHGIDVRPDVIERSRARADELGWDHLTFEVREIEGMQLERAPDIVVALHACDTATDDALALAVRSRASVILAAPCCQRELASQLELGPPSHTSPALIQHGLLRRDYAATLTDALRIDALDVCGYKVDTVEFVESQHTPKNLLIRAHRRPGARVNLSGLRDIRIRCEALGVRPRLLDALEPQQP